MNDWLSWVATIATIGGAVLTASNLGAKVTGSGFVVFLVGSLCWLAVGMASDQRALVWTNAVLTLLNLFGIWRWLGRQAAVESGARTAAEASEQTPGEALFPVSLLTRAPVDMAGTQVATCVDAMAAAESGRIDYVVVSEGGVAGVGERLRRLSWSDAKFDQGRLVAGMGKGQFGRLPEIEKDQWPAR